MRLISSADAVNFLSQLSPAPWVTRMLFGMILDQEIAAYFSKARVRARVPASYFIYDIAQKSGVVPGPKMDAAIRDAYAPELADRIVGKALHDDVYDDPQGWEEGEPQIGDTGFFLYADEIDWDAGTLRAKYLPNDRERADFLFPNEELFSTDFERAEYEAEFVGMSFEHRAIEMLLPNIPLKVATVAKLETGGRVRAVGRPPKWDWEGVLAYVVSQAQLPDGLPTGPGAQARLEEMMSEWFLDECDDAPSLSQIRQRASSIIKKLERPNKPEIK